MKPLFFILVGSVLVLSGCTKPFLHDEASPPSPPTGLQTATGDNFIDLSWFRNSEPDVAGYNVFVSATYDGTYELIGSTRANSFRDDGAVNGNIYYYAVTAYDNSGNESSLSRDVVYDIPRPEGYNVTLNDDRLNASSAGYDFSNYAVLPFDDQAADMFFEVSGGSPLMNVRTDTDIQDLGPTASILDITSAPEGGWAPTHNVVLQVGHTYAAWTWDDHYAKFRVSALTLTRVVFDWVYQLRPSSPFLKHGTGGAATGIGRPR